MVRIADSYGLLHMDQQIGKGNREKFGTGSTKMFRDKIHEDFFPGNSRWILV